jgi:hypothetical protein
MLGGSSHDRRKAERAGQQHSPNATKFMSSTSADRKSVQYLWLGILWSSGIAVGITLVAASSITRLRIVVLAIVGALCVSIAAYVHGWTKSRIKAFLVFVFVGIVMGAIGWQSRPLPKMAVVEMRISPSGFPISIPPHSVVSILRLHPYIILSDTNDYLLKDENTQSKEFSWPSQKEIDSKDSNDYETVFRVELVNHSEEALAAGKLLFRLLYNAGLSGGGCMPPKGKPDYQNDFVLLPQLDPGKSFEFYAVNQSPSCVWLIPPEIATIKMVSDDVQRQIALTLDKNPLYASGVPVFPPTKIKWETLPIKSNSYQVYLIVN